MVKKPYYDLPLNHNENEETPENVKVESVELEDSR